VHSQRSSRLAQYAGVCIRTAGLRPVGRLLRSIRAHLAGPEVRLPAALFLAATLAAGCTSTRHQTALERLGYTGIEANSPQETPEGVVVKGICVIDGQKMSYTAVFDGDRLVNLEAYPCE